MTTVDQKYEYLMIAPSCFTKIYPSTYEFPKQRYKYGNQNEFNSTYARLYDMETITRKWPRLFTKFVSNSTIVLDIYWHKKHCRIYANKDFIWQRTRSLTIQIYTQDNETCCLFERVWSFNLIRRVIALKVFRTQLRILHSIKSKLWIAFANIYVLTYIRLITGDAFRRIFCSQFVTCNCIRSI